MTYKGYNPTSMPADAPVEHPVSPEIKAPPPTVSEPESRSDA